MENSTRADKVVASLFRATLWMERAREHIAGYMYRVEEPRLIHAYYDLMSGPETLASLDHIQREQVANLIRNIFLNMDRFSDSDMRYYAQQSILDGYIPDWTINQIGHFAPPHGASETPLVDCFLVRNGNIYYTWRYDTERLKQFKSIVSYERKMVF